MGGESRPWGIAFGHPGQTPTLLSVPEGRNRDLVADMCAEFAPLLLEHFRTPRYTRREPTQWEDLGPLRQVWLPNPSHLEMLHHLAYAYTFTRWGAGARARLNAFGRLCGWLQREAQRAGQQHVMVATDALRRTYTFPSQDQRQGHLGYLLGWLGDQGDRATRAAAASQAERLAISTTLDPEVERDQTEQLVSAWQAAARAGNETEKKASSDQLRLALEPELERRFDLTVAALRILRGDPRRTNSGVTDLVKEALREQWYQHTRLELNRDEEEDGPAFTPSPETDRYPAAASSRYQVHLASADLAASLLLHDDPELQAEAIASGDAFCGTITRVWDSNSGRATDPVWLIEDRIGGVLRLREGSWVCLAGMPKRTGTIERIETGPDGTRIFEVLITGAKTKPDLAVHPSHVGRNVVFVTNSAHEINRRKSQRVWRRDTPGAWLTHARPKGPRTVINEEAAEGQSTVVPLVDLE
jgi:hypothetical protein